MSSRGLGLLALLVGVPPAPTLLAQRPFTQEVARQLVAVSSPQLNPAGDLLAYTRTTTDWQANRRATEIVIRAVSDGAERGRFAGSAPKWSPDGRWILFSGSRAGQNGFVLREVATGQERFLVAPDQTDHWTGAATIKNIEWSPDGSHVAYVAADGPRSPSESDVYATSRIMYKTRTGFSDNRRTSIWLLAVAGGTPRNLTPGDWDEHSLAWSPDGRRIVFVSDRSEDPDNTYANDLWTVDVGSGAVTRLTNSSSAQFQAHYAPDGTTLAFTAWTRPFNTKDSPAEDAQLFVMPAAGGEARSLTRAFDRRVGAPTWSPDGRFLYFSAGDRGMQGIYRVSAAGGEVTPVVRCECSAAQYTLARRGTRMAWVQSTSTTPGDIWIAEQDGRNARQFTRENAALLTSVSLQSAETFWFDSWDGTPVQAWIIRPHGWQEGQRYPVILNIHGGPHGMYGWGFTERFQTMAGRGYGVLYINPRGSSGYGQRFSDGTLNNWGGGDYQDLMRGVDEALRRYPWMDGERMGVIGGSYGGYMTNWVITQTPRFKAAVSIASVSNLVSFYGTSLYTDLIEAEFNGLPWNNWGMLWQWSPLAHVHKAETPTLFLHGVNDHDVPITQAEEMYVALRKRGVAATFVRYPNEGHSVQQPRHLLDFNGRIEAWFDQYLRPAGLTP